MAHVRPLRRDDDSLYVAFEVAHRHLNCWVFELEIFRSRWLAACCGCRSAACGSTVISQREQRRIDARG